MRRAGIEEEEAGLVSATERINAWPRYASYCVRGKTQRHVHASARGKKLRLCGRHLQQPQMAIASMTTREGGNDRSKVGRQPKERSRIAARSPAAALFTADR
jgi:hypothetical protein